MNKYGLTNQDLKNIQSKIENQSDFLDDNFFTTSSGQVKTLREVSFSANHSVRYYAQLSNKIDTMTKTAMSQGLHSCFLTMTLDGYFRDLLHGDYTRFDKLSHEDKKIALQSVPASETLGEVRQKIEARKSLSVKDLYNILNHQTKNYLKSYAFKKLKKSEQEYMYIRTVEPHKDGVPHFHMMLYIPGEHIEQFKKDFIKSYPAPRNRAKIKGSDEMEAFQTDIRDTTAYIMKYILKSFMDVKKQKELDYIQAWYIKHRIIRCVTSRALVPQWVYQKAYAFESDWYHLTDLMKDKNNHVEWNKEDNYFYFIDNHTGRELIYQYGKYQVIYGDRIIKEMGEVKEKRQNNKVYDKTPKQWTKKQKPLNVIIDGEHFTYFNGKCSKPLKMPYQMNDYELFEYYQNLDIETCDLKHYGNTKNILIDRGLLDEPKVSLAAYQDDFFKFKSEVF